MSVPELSGWINYYADGLMSHLYSTREEADECAGDHRIACLYASITEGEKCE